MADLAEQLEKLRQALQMGGEHNEGTDGGRGDVFGSGDSYESFTWPKGVELVDEEGEGVLKYPYDGMVRHKHYMATVETATEDDHFSGVIQASYTISRRGTVYIANNIQFQPGQKRRVGNSIISRIRTLDGISI
jgi:hypothetical protein